MPTLIGASEAAGLLGVTKPTLYAYVSRGSVTRRVAVDGRTSLYDRDEIEALAGRSRPEGTCRATIDRRTDRHRDHRTPRRLTVLPRPPGRRPRRGALLRGGRGPAADRHTPSWSHGLVRRPVCARTSDADRRGSTPRRPGHGHHAGGARDRRFAARGNGGRDGAVPDLDRAESARWTAHGVDRESARPGMGAPTAGRTRRRDRGRPRAARRSRTRNEHPRRPGGRVGAQFAGRSHRERSRGGGRAAPRRGQQDRGRTVRRCRLDGGPGDGGGQASSG